MTVVSGEASPEFLGGGEVACAVAVECGAIVLAVEVVVSHLDIFQRLHRIPGMDLLHIRVFGIILGFHVGHRGLAVGMALGIIFRRTDIDAGIAA